jgi:hypothetical protein
MRLTILDKCSILIVVHFISVKMCECEVWKDSSDAKFENVTDGMEKLVMNRLYD